MKKAKAQALVWVVVITKPGQERRAKRELEQQGFETYLPMKLAMNRKKEVTASPFFPRYLFARVDLAQPGWRAIWSTYGVAGLLGGTAERPLGVRDKAIAEIRSHEESGYIKIGLDEPAPAFQRGERVRTVGDIGFEGVFYERVDERRALILVSCLGRDSRLTVDLRKLMATGGT